MKWGIVYWYCLSVIISFSVVLDLQLSLKFPEIEPYYTLMIVCLGIGIFTIFFIGLWLCDRCLK